MRDPLAIRLTGYIPADHRPPHAPQHAFLALNCPEALYGGAAGGGKSDALLMAALQYVDVPGYAAILFRKTYADLAKPGALMFRSKEWLLNTDARWREGQKEWRFPSGATLSFGYLDHPDDKYNYQSAEFQFIGFDELTQFNEPDYRYLFSRLRKPATGPLATVPLRMRAASNPGGRGHVWVRSRFIKKERSDMDDELGTDPRERIFVPAKLSDNPSVEQESYKKQLMHLDPQTRQQLLEGDWDAREPGACFYEFNWANHTLPGTRPDNSSFPVVRCIDFGLHHAVCQWVEVQGGRTAVVFFELHSQGKDLHQFAEDIVHIDRQFGTLDAPAYIDPAGLGTNYQTGKKDSDVLAEYGISVANLDNSDRYSPETRTSLIKRLLRTGALYLSRDYCPYTIEALERATWDTYPGTGAFKDTYKKDGMWDHPIDALGEGLVRVFGANPATAAETEPSFHYVRQFAYSGSEFG